MNSEDIRRIIVGHIPPGQISLYRALYLANQPLTVNSIAHIMLRDGDVVSAWGVIKALANRIGDATSKSPKYLAFFEVETIDEVQYFQMRSELRKAIESIPELLEAIKWLCSDPLKLDNYDSSSRIGPRKGRSDVKAKNVYTRLQGTGST